MADVKGMVIPICLLFVFGICRDIFEARAMDIPDNQGKEFIIGFMEAMKYGGQKADHSTDLFITTSQSSDVDVTITAPKARSINLHKRFKVKRGRVEHVVLSKELRLSGTSLDTKGIYIVGSDEIIVYGMNSADYSTDGFLALPLNVLGRKYYVPSFLNLEYHLDFFYSAVLVVSTRDGTEVNVRLTTNSISSSKMYKTEVIFKGRTYRSGQWINTTIDRFDTMQLQSVGDLTGTLVLSSYAVAVFGGNPVTSVGSESRDHIEEQIPPVDTWGRNFVINPIPLSDKKCFIRILSSEDDTKVTIDGITRKLELNGQYLEVTSNSLNFVQSDKPILVVQYAPSSPAHGDPAMVIIPPIEQFNTYYAFSTPLSSQGQQFSNFFIFVIESSYATGIMLDNRPVHSDEIHNLRKSRYSKVSGGYIQISHGKHVVTHNSSLVTFSGILYGSGNYESYFYPIGQRFAPIAKNCSKTLMVIGDGRDNDCDGHIDEEICNDYKDNDNDKKLDEDCITAVQLTTQEATTSQTTAVGKSTSESTSLKTSSKTTPEEVTVIPKAQLLTYSVSKNAISKQIRHPSYLLYTKISSTQETTTNPTTTVEKTPRVSISIKAFSKTTPEEVTMMPNSKILSNYVPVKVVSKSTRRQSDVQYTKRIHRQQHFTRPRWLITTEYGTVSLVCIVITGAVGCLCKRCLCIIGRRQEDDDDEEERRKKYRNARKRLGIPQSKPTTK